MLETVRGPRASAEAKEAREIVLRGTQPATTLEWNMHPKKGDFGVNMKMEIPCQLRRVLALQRRSPRNGGSGGKRRWQTASLRSCMALLAVAGFLQLCQVPPALGQRENSARKEQGSAAASETPYSSLNTWSFFGEYSPNSSHIFLGVTEKRRLVFLGGEYTRRLRLNGWMGLYYLAQARPLMLESDPVLLGYEDVSSHRLLFPFAKPPRVEMVVHTLIAVPPGNVVVTQRYGREWTYAGGANPLGIKWNLRSRHRLQPVLLGATGFLISARDVPIDHASTFNFSFEFGAGLEWFYEPKRSLRVDYRIQHISSANIGTENPGIDSGLFQFSYSFGR